MSGVEMSRFWDERAREDALFFIDTWPGLRERAGELVGRRPRGREDPAWLGSAVELPALRDAASGAGLAFERVIGEGTQYCAVLARRG